MTIVIVVMIPVVAVLAFAVVTVHPMVMRFVTGNPDHFIVTIPIAVAMGVIVFVAYVNLNAIRTARGRQQDAGSQEADEGKFFYIHTRS